MKLSKVNPAKGPDGIPSWVLKENADLLADPVKEILNLLYRDSSTSFPGLSYKDEWRDERR
jgi:hypothetical protein